MESIIEFVPSNSLSLSVGGICIFSFFGIWYLLSAFSSSPPKENTNLSLKISEMIEWKKDEFLKLFYVKNKTNTQILERCSNLHKESLHYRPPFYAQSGFFQSFFNSAIRRSPMLSFFRTEEIDSQGGHFALDWTIEKTEGDPQHKNPIVIVVPGIVGHSKQHYIRHFVHECHRNGWNSIVINHRGCNSKLSVKSILILS